MNKFLMGIVALTISMSIFSCSKSSSNNNPIIGEWTWAQTYFGKELTPANTAIRKTIIFNTTNIVTLMHNDSIGQSFQLSVIDTVPLSKAITETESYTTFNPNVLYHGNLPFTDSTFLNIGNDVIGYQYSISGDSLILMNGPGLAPVPSVYLRVK